ncbi:hypothetical protein [Streptomyces sp. NPDC051016]|uniref:hypothetical protein n=1 Tax=Streptomyces sp. NPDC051016 TaxID=3365638 RepID=UPI0037B3D021
MGAVVNNGGNVVVGTSKTIRYLVDITVKDNESSCTKRSVTTSVCRATLAIDPAWIADYKVKRAAQLTTVIAAEKAAKGAGATVTGKLSRADWEDLKYHGFTGQRVKLQFRKNGAAHYSTVRTVTTGDAGKLSTKVTVTSAGSRRWCFPGTTTTSRKVSAGDALGLK